MLILTNQVRTGLISSLVHLYKIPEKIQSDVKIIKCIFIIKGALYPLIEGMMVTAKNANTDRYIPIYLEYFVYIFHITQKHSKNMISIIII